MSTTTREQLKWLKESVDTLVNYQDYGGDLEHAFNLHIDSDKLDKAISLLDSMLIDMESE